MRSQLAHISTHAPAGGATSSTMKTSYLTRNFYSRPCGRGDLAVCGGRVMERLFLLTPLREGRPSSTLSACALLRFLLTPLREGRLFPGRDYRKHRTHFYSRPCGRGDQSAYDVTSAVKISTHAPAGGATAITHLYADNRKIISTHAPAGGATITAANMAAILARISTHAPAGGATAIFHKFVMRFCGKLPKDDTVLCLASFGFPRRDPKAVYLTWISCANLPQKCVRQGLALKDQGTSCFHEGLASHAFDPVLV